jgi:hypothetical protein
VAARFMSSALSGASQKKTMHKNLRRAVLTGVIALLVLTTGRRVLMQELALVKDHLAVSSVTRGRPAQMTALHGALTGIPMVAKTFLTSHAVKDDPLLANRRLGTSLPLAANLLMEIVHREDAQAGVIQEPVIQDPVMLVLAVKNRAASSQENPGASLQASLVASQVENLATGLEEAASRAVVPAGPTQAAQERVALDPLDRAGGADSCVLLQGG